MTNSYILAGYMWGYKIQDCILLLPICPFSFTACLFNCPDTLKNYFTSTKLALWVRNWQQDLIAGCMNQVIWFTKTPRRQTCKVLTEFVYTCITHDHSNLLKHRLCLPLPDMTSSIKKGSHSKRRVWGTNFVLCRCNCLCCQKCSFSHIPVTL